jgi:hypothetical protein
MFAKSEKAIAGWPLIFIVPLAVAAADKVNPDRVLDLPEQR